VNRNHGLYQRDVSYGVEKKLVIPEVYRSHLKANHGGRPNLSEVAKFIAILSFVLASTAYTIE
jgi:hypothetical protein